MANKKKLPHEKKITIIIPAKYEQGAILRTLKLIKNNVKTPHNVVVVNDSDASDPTVRIVKEYKKTHRNVNLFVKRDPSRATFGRALLIGLKAAKTEYAVPVMGDLCDDPKTIDKMYKKIAEGWDIVCGSRYMKGGKKTGGPVIQSFFSRFVCLTLHKITGIPTKDVSNAFKMYRKGAINNLTIDPTNGVEVSMNITLQAFFHNARITEIPTKWSGRRTDKSKFKIFERTPRYLSIYTWALKKTLTR